MLRKRLLIALLFAALAVAVRLPFLITGKIQFDSDEAVEGLMALHVLDGELPAFFWGQAFKGVPEVYAAAAAFGTFGSSVTVLKSVTLVIFAAFVALNFVLLDRIASRWIAIATALLLIVSPPALVLWSLCASAEYMWIMLLGTALLLTLDRAEGGGQKAEGRGQRADGLLFRVGLIAGFGLWVHQLFVIYLLPLLIILALRHRVWRHQVFDKMAPVAVFVGAVASVYVALAAIAFFTSGIEFRIGPVAVSATAPQKLLRIAIAIAAVAAVIQVASRTRFEVARRVVARHWPLGAGFVLGYLPVVLYSVFVEPSRAPSRVANLRQLIAAAPDIFGNILPIITGFKIATTERLDVPAIAALPGAAAIAAYLWSRRSQFGRSFFPTFLLFVPVLFLGAGVYLDTLSYRYLIPWYAGLTVAWAAGSRALGRKAGVVVLAAIVAVHGWQQWLWYQKLQPDTVSIATIACLKQKGIRGGFAEYWTSYKLTFLANETIIIAPTDGIDRYPRYTEFVRSLPEAQKVRLKPDTSPLCGSGLQVPGSGPEAGSPKPDAR